MALFGGNKEEVKSLRVEEKKQKKEESRMNALDAFGSRFNGDAEKHLFEGERVIQCFGLALDYACITNKRLFFVDKKINSISNKKIIVSIPFSSINAVELETGVMVSEVEIKTRNGEYELKLLNDTGDIFVKKLLQQAL